MSQKTHCPVCGSTDISFSEHYEILSESYGGSKEILLFENFCNTCETPGDFEEKNDGIIQSTVDELKARAVVNILNDFIENGFNLSSMERVLELPQRTLAKWKNTGKPSAAGVSLLKLIRCFPWLLEVAEQNFEFQSAQKIYISTAYTFIANNSTYMDPLKIKAEEKSPFSGMSYTFNDNSIRNVTINLHSSTDRDFHSEQIINSPQLTCDR
ncbi:MAG: hypothetical protein VR65_24845 [Desulfobulbaceae bacterium BRH_c16a]|nr:MAG: hypothetical protein VR65_24845 [Desulfobulbaceae bacterium BRH_c16a]